MRTLFILVAILFNTVALAEYRFPIGGKVFDKSNPSDYLRFHCLEDDSLEDCALLFVARTTGEGFYLDRSALEKALKNKLWGEYSKIGFSFFEDLFFLSQIAVHYDAYVWLFLSLPADLVRSPYVFVRHPIDWIGRRVRSARYHRALKYLNGVHRRSKKGKDSGLGKRSYKKLWELLQEHVYLDRRAVGTECRSFSNATGYVDFQFRHARDGSLRLDFRGLGSNLTIAFDLPVSIERTGENARRFS